MPKQPTIIELLTMAQEMPEDVQRQQNFLLGLVANGEVFDGMLSEQQQVFQQILIANPLQENPYD